MRDDDALEHNPGVSREALDALHGPLFGWCMSRCAGDRPAAEDLMQQAYMELLSGRARFEGQSSLKTFVFGVVQVLFKGRKRKMASRLRLVSRMTHETASAEYPAFADDDRAGRIWRAVQNLPGQQRDMTELVFCREMTIAEAASVMQISLGAGRAHYDRAKRSLAKTLADLNKPDELETDCG